jgi:hypothetical protein
MADYQLAAPLEQVDQARFPIRSFEHIFLFDPDHRQPAAIGAQGVALPGELLLPGEQVLAGGQPLLS